MKHTGIMLFAAALLLTGCTEPQSDCSEAPAVTGAVTDAPEITAAQATEPGESGTKQNPQTSGGTTVTGTTAAGEQKAQDDLPAPDQDGVIAVPEQQEQAPSETLPPFDPDEDGVIELPAIPLN